MVIMQSKSFSIITTEPNEDMAFVRERMPLILHNREQRRQWLDEPDLDTVLAMMQPLPDGLLGMYQTSDFVDPVTNNGPESAPPDARDAYLF